MRIRHGRIDWWATGIQLLGTLWFNRTTLSALLVGLGASSNHHPIWRPDALGSICFLVSSWLAWVEECHGPFAWRPARLSWWITTLNLVGSVAFGVSAIASYVTSSGQLLSVALTNLGTFVGAICFLVGALLLLPERTLEVPSADPEPGPAPSDGQLVVRSDAGAVSDMLAVQAGDHRHRRGAHPVDDGGERVEVADAEVTEAPALPAGDEVLRDLLVGAEAEEWCRQRVGHSHPGAPGDGDGDLVTLVGDDHRLDERMQLDRGSSGRPPGAHPGHGVVEPGSLPADVVVLPVLPGLSEHGRGDDVGMADSMGQGCPAVHADEQRDMLLSRWEGGCLIEAVVRPVEGHRPAVEEGADDLDRLAEAFLAHSRRVERPPHGPVLREAVAGPETHLEASSTQMVERRQLLGQRHGVVQVVVEHQGAETDPFGAHCRRRQGDERRRLPPHVVTDLEHVEAGLLRQRRRAARRRRGRSTWPGSRSGRAARIDDTQAGPLRWAGVPGSLPPSGPECRVGRAGRGLGRAARDAKERSC